MTPPPSTASSPSLALADADESVHQHETTTDPLLGEMINGSLGPLTRLADTIDLTLDQVSDWIMRPANRQQISNLVTLLDAQTQLMICQHRLLAVARLGEVATTATSPETVRRACADLLKIRLIDPYKEDKRPEKMPPPPDIDQDDVRAMFQQLGSQPDDPQHMAPLVPVSSSVARPQPPLSNHVRDPDRPAVASNGSCATEPQPDSFSQNGDSAGMKSKTGAHRRAQTKPSPTPASANATSNGSHPSTQDDGGATESIPAAHAPPSQTDLDRSFL